MLMKQFFRALSALVFLAVLPWSQVTAQQLQPVPALTAHLIDKTQTLSAEQALAVETRLRGIEEKSGSQVVVLMVPTTAPEDIAAYAWRVADSWKIGRKDVGDGLLLLVAKDDRRMRLEVARALEGAIPDLAASRIIDQHMAPRFRQNDYAGGILAALDQVAVRIAGEALPAPSASRQPSQPEQDWDFEQLAIFFFFGVMVAGPMVRGIFGNKLGAAIMGGGTGFLAYFLTTSMLLAGGAGVIALLVTLLSNGRRGGGGGGPFIGGGGGGWGSGGGGFGSGGGGFSSGGGGSFGGGGASGSW